jgi:Leu/Phe-tRNA-protein transferase
MHSDHMAQFGAREIDRPEFESLLHDAVDQSLVIDYPTFLIDKTEMHHE